MGVWLLLLVAFASEVHSQDRSDGDLWWQRWLADYLDYSETQFQDDRTIAEATLNKDPHFQNEGGYVRARMGNTVELPCRIGNLGTYGTQWMRGNTVIYPADKMPPKIHRKDDNSLVIEYIKSEDAGNYTCVVLMDPPLKLMFHLQVFAPGGVLCFECEWSLKISREHDICTTDNFSANAAHVSYCHHGCELSHFYEKDKSGEYEMSRFTRGCAENSIVESTCKDSEVLNWKSHICRCSTDLCNKGTSLTPATLVTIFGSLWLAHWQIL